MAKERLDILLVDKGLAPSREKAKAIIMSGCVYVDGQKEDKCGSKFEEKATIEVRGNTLPYVSRGGLKLEKAIKNFDVSLSGKICMDVGSSTGGFTDCLLQHGAARVYAVDVGREQLHERLRADARVVSMEGINLRLAPPDLLPEPVDLVVADVSFISLTRVLPPCLRWLKEGGRVAALIKPQFEAGREKVGKKGVVREKGTHHEVIEKVAAYAHSIGFEIRNIDYSPIKGPEGNIEYLIHLKKHVKYGRITVFEKRNNFFHPFS